jgi:hypothetical protein
VKARRPLRIPIVLAWTVVAGGGLGAGASCSSPELFRGPCPSADTTADASDAATDAAEDVACDAPVYSA